MAVRYLTKEEKEMIVVGLNMRKCYIETGSTTLGASDMARMDPKHAWRAYGAKVNALTEDQMKLILATNELERKIYSDKIYVEE